MEALGKVSLGALHESHDFPVRPDFAPDDSLVIDLAYFLVWSGVYPHVRDTHPRLIRALRHRLYARLAERFTPRQIEEMTWRFTQCLAFNLHNDFLEIEDDPR